MKRAWALGWVVVWASACASDGDADPEPRSAVEPVAAPIDAMVVANLDPPEGSEHGFVTHWDVLGRRLNETARERKRQGLGTPHLVHSLHGEHLELQLVAVDSSLPEPEVPAAEVLVFVEGGTGVLELEGGVHRRIEPGTIAVLPAGARKRLLAGVEPILALIVRSKHRATQPGEVQITHLDEVWVDAARPRDSLEPDGYARLVDERVAGVAGALSVDLSRVWTFVSPQRHPDHERVELLLQGEGSYGLGSAGHIMKNGSLAFVPSGQTHFFRCAQQWIQAPTDPSGGAQTGEAAVTERPLTQQYDAAGALLLVIHAPEFGSDDTQLVVSDDQ